MRSGIRISAAAAAIVLLTGCGGTTVHGAVPTPPPEASAAHRPVHDATPSATPTEGRPFSPGPPAITYRTQEGAATLQIRRYSWQWTANGRESAPPQNYYLVLDVQVTATEGSVSVNPLYFVARTPTQTFAPTMGADGNEPVLSSVDLGVNETAEGIVTFDAPPTHVTIQINDELGRNVGEIVIPAPLEHERKPAEAPGEPPPAADAPAQPPGEDPAQAPPEDAAPAPDAPPEEAGAAAEEAGAVPAEETVIGG